MDVIDKDTKKPFRLKASDEFNSDIQAHEKNFDCTHESAEPRRTTDAGGAQHFHRQCLQCGRKIGSAIGRAQAPTGAPPFDKTLAEAYEARRKSAYADIVQKHVRLQKSKNTEFWRKYNAYLATPEWKSRHDRVMKRANYICEGCLEHPATEVHHLSYENHCNEFLFELVAICKPCHERFHTARTARALGEDADTSFDDLDYYFEEPCCGCSFQSEHNDELWCGKFDISALDAMADEGPCGPKQRELEPLK